MKVRKFYPRQVLRKFVGKPRVLSTGQEQKKIYIIDVPGTRLSPEFTRALNPDLDYSKFNLNPFSWK